MRDLLEGPADYVAVVEGRRCSRCGEIKPIEEFSIKNKTTGLRRVWCRDCARAYGREHYQKNRAAYLAKTQRRRQESRPVVKAKIDAYLREHPCVDCGCTDITVLEFDHRDPLDKDRDIARLARSAEWPRVLTEIEKCDVRCANCHRKRTAAQFSWAKESGVVLDPNVVRPGQTGRYATLPSPLQLRLISTEPHGLRRCSRCGELKPLSEFTFRDLLHGVPSYYCRPCKAGHRRAHYLANRPDYMARAMTEMRLKRQEDLARLLEYLRAHPCVDCGEMDIRVLEFDHVDPAVKEMSVAAMLGRRSWASIMAEIDRCVVRCANCHRRRTAKQQGWRVRIAERSGSYLDPLQSSLLAGVA